MKCPKCIMVEMIVEKNKDNKIVYVCPRCQERVEK